jgi:hypothetical protein
MNFRKDNVIVIGHIGLNTAMVCSRLAEQGINDAIIVAPDNAKETLKSLQADQFSEPIRITAPLPFMPTEKGFVCTGKHQYKRVVTDKVVTWVCECGRKTND